MDEVKIWAVDDASTVVSLDSKSQVDTEALLEETLVRNPGLLMPGLTLVGRQTPTPGGPLDLLGVDEDGRLVVFELKRGTLSRETPWPRSSTTPPILTRWNWPSSPSTYPKGRVSTASTKFRTSRTGTTVETSGNWSP